MTEAMGKMIGKLLPLLAAALIAGCTEPGPPAPPGPTVDLVWPEPPATPRIRFVKTLRTAEDLGIKPSTFESIVGFIKGTRERRLAQPYGLARDAEGRLYVVDVVQKAVRVFDTARRESYWFPTQPVKGLEGPIGVAVGRAGRVYVSDSRRGVVHVFEEHGKRYLRTIGDTVLERPTGLAVHPVTGDLLVADTLASQIVVFDVNTLRPIKFVGRAGEGSEAFHSPTDVAVSREGRIYVTDSLNFRIQVLGPDFTFLNSFGEPGDSPGRFSRPKGLALDSDGNVYVVDALFDNVQIFDRDGRLLLAFGGPGAGFGQFWLPSDIFIDGDDRIYVSDSHNQRVQVFQYLKEGPGQ